MTPGPGIEPETNGGKQALSPLRHPYSPDKIRHTDNGKASLKLFRFLCQTSNNYLRNEIPNEIRAQSLKTVHNVKEIQ